MSEARDAVGQSVRGLLKELAGDWDYRDDISDGTLLFRQLGFQSLDIVVLGAAIQERYGRQLPFAQLFADIGRDGRDLSVAELVDFVARHVNSTDAGPGVIPEGAR
jgi:acyl carrier protein